MQGRELQSDQIKWFDHCSFPCIMCLRKKPEGSDGVRATSGERENT